MTTYSTPMGNPVRLTDIGSLVESGGNPNWAYVPQDYSDPQPGNTGRFPLSIPAGRDGSIAIKISNVHGTVLGLNTTSNKPNLYHTPTYSINNYQAGSAYQAQSDQTNISLNNAPIASNGDTIQVRRTGKDIIAEVSHDDGATWSTIYTWLNVGNSTALYGFTMLGYSSAVSAVYSKGLLPSSSTATFGGLSAGAAVRNFAWDTLDTVWPDSDTERLKADGNGYAVRDVSSANSFVAGWWPLRSSDVRGAVFFKHTNSTDSLSPRLMLTAATPGTAMPSGVKAYLDSGNFIVSEIKSDGTVGATVSTPLVLQANNEYCIELCLSEDASNKVYYARLMTASGGTRSTLVAQSTLTIGTAIVPAFVAIVGATQSSAMDPISKVQSIAYQFVLGTIAATPIDDGTTVTSYIGSASDCHFADFDSWWDFVPQDLVAQGRKHKALVDKTTELLIQPFTLSGKNTDSSHGIFIGARPGHSYFENTSFKNNALRYNPANGAAVATTIANANAVFDIQQDYVIVDGLQFQNRGGGNGDSISVVKNNQPNSSYRRVIADTGNLSGGDTSIVRFSGNGSKHFGCYFIATSPVGRGVFTVGDGVSLEKCTVAAAVDVHVNGSWAGCCWTNQYMVNVATFGFDYPMLMGNSGQYFFNNVTDQTFPATPNGQSGGNISNAVYADQFVNVTAANMDLRLKPGSALYNAGIALASWDTSTVFENVPDVGAWEQDHFSPTALFISNLKSTVTSGLSTTFKVSTNLAFVSNETATVVVSDNANGVFSPSNFVLSVSNPSQTVTYTPTTDYGTRNLDANCASGTYALTDGTATLQVVAPVPATTLVVNNLADISLGQSETINLSTDNSLFADQSISYVVTSDGGATITPSNGTLSKTNQDDDIVITPIAQGTLNLTFTPNGTPSLSVLKKTFKVNPRLPTYATGDNYYELGVDRQFTKLSDLISYLSNRDLVGDKARVFITVFDSMTVNGYLRTASASSDYYITIQPGVGRGYRDLATSGLYYYPNAGVELTIGGGDFTLMKATHITGFRLRFDDGSKLVLSASNGSGGNGGRHLFDYNRVLVNRTGTDHVIYSGEYSQSANVKNNVFIVTQPGRFLYLQDGSGDLTGNTAVATGSAVNGTYMAWGTFGGLVGTIIQNNAFVDCGPEPMNFSRDANINQYNVSTFNNNYTNIAIGSSANPIMSIGFTENTEYAFVNDKTNDLRPAAGSPLLGKATSLAVSTNDAAGANRGYSPDAGAFQRVPATSLPIPTKKTQLPQGSKLSLALTYLNTIETLTVLLEADSSNPNGAVTQGPFVVSFANGTASIDILNIPAGNYKAPVFTCGNSGGSVISNDFSAVAISSILAKATLPDTLAVADAILATAKTVLPFMGVVVSNGVVVSKSQVSFKANKSNFVTADSLALTVTINDAGGLSKVTTDVAKIDFYKDNSLVGSKTAPSQNTGDNYDYLYSETIPTGSTGSNSYYAIVTDSAGKTVQTQSITVTKKVPADGSTVPTITSVTAVNGDSNYGLPHLEVVFSTAMDTSKDFDFANSGHYALGVHTVITAAWASPTKLILGTDRYSSLHSGEVFTFSYRKSSTKGWRSVAGVLAESVYDVPVVNQISDNTGYLGVQKFDAMAAGTALAGTTFTLATSGPDLTGITWPSYRDSNQNTIYVPQQWDGSLTHLQADGAGGAVPSDNTHNVLGVLHLGTVVNNNYGHNGTYGQIGLAAFFKLKTTTDDVYGVQFRSQDNTGDANRALDTTLGSGVNAWVTPDGMIHVNHVPADGGYAPLVIPPVNCGQTLQVGQEYCLEISMLDADTIAATSVRLWTATNGVRTTLIKGFSFFMNEPMDNNWQFCKLTRPTLTSTPAVLTRVETLYYDFYAQDLLPVLNLSSPARLIELSNVVESGSAGSYTYTGNGATIDQLPGGVVDQIYTHNGGQGTGIQATIGSAVNNIHLGLTYSLVNNTPAEAVLAVNRMLLAIRASALNANYEVMVNGKLQTAAKQVPIKTGDAIRIRQIGGMMLVDVLPVGASVWIRLYTLRNIIPYKYNSLLSSQFILPGNSTISNVMY